MQSLSEMLAANVPRYTSYPTAPHFHPGVDGTVYDAWLADTPDDAPLSLYVHVPFCDTLCWFCGCHTSIVHRYEPVQSYCGLLLAEIELICAALGTERRVSHIHWGGGSPTLLRNTEITQLNGAIRKGFSVDVDAEFGVEIDPRGFDRQDAVVLKAAGLTRASIGVQDCDPGVQRAINRIQGPDQTRAAVIALREVGVESINLDLVYGLPLQTMKSWEATLDFAVSLAPDRLSVFGYAHVPSMKKHQALIHDADLPGVAARFALAQLAAEILDAHGYAAIGLDHYAKRDDALAQAARRGTLQRNFQGYTADDAGILLGLGASAIGSLPQGYVQNHVSVSDYRRDLERGVLPVSRGLELCADDRMRRAVIQALMCDLTVDLKQIAVCHEQDVSVFADSVAAIVPLQAAGVVNITGSRIQIDRSCKPAVRLVCACFDRYLGAPGVRHSRSV